MAQQVNVFAKLDVNLILIFKTQMMKKQTPEIVLRLPCTFNCMYVPFSQINNVIEDVN